MNFKKIVAGFLRVFVISLIATLAVTFLWNLVLHGVAKLDWETSFRFAILFGIILPLADARRNRG